MDCNIVSQSCLFANYYHHIKILFSNLFIGKYLFIFSMDKKETFVICNTFCNMYQGVPRKKILKKYIGP